MPTKKFMQTLDSKQYMELSDLAKKRGTNVQTFIRAIVVPEWLGPQQQRQSAGTDRSRTTTPAARRRHGAMRRTAQRIRA